MRLLEITIVGCLIGIAASQFAAMSIDLGTQFMKIGIVKPGIPMDIALNTESRRKTPNVVLIQDAHRTFGDAAIGLQIRYPHLVFGQINDLVAKNAKHPSFEVFSRRNAFYEVSDTPRNESSISFKIGDESYSVETLSAMILANARKFTSEYAQVAGIKDVVITVPVYFTSAERLAVERAAQMAGFNVLQLMNDGTAAALSHGIFRRKEIGEKPQRLMVYDMGAAKTTATIVEYKLVKEKYEKQPKMTVLGVGYDRTLGGIEMTQRLREHLIDMFEKTYKPKTAVRTNRRAVAKFAKEAERLKQVLSANAEHFAQIESAHEDIDVKLRVTRDEFNSLIEDLETRIAEPIEQALRMAQMPIEDIDQFVLMGAGTRVPKVQEIIQKTIGSKEIGKFLNTDEATAMGALFQAAHLSNGFKVKPFNVEDLVLFPVDVQFLSKVKKESKEAGETRKEVRKTLFAAKSFFPSSTKTITLTSYLDDFSISLKYGKSELLTKKQIGEIGNLLNELVDVKVGGLGEALAERSGEEYEFMGVKVSFQIDASGITRIRKAEAVIEKKKGIVGTIANTISGFFSSSSGEEASATEETSGSEEKEEKEGKSEETSTVTPPTSNSTEGRVNVTDSGVNATVVEPELSPIVRLRLSTVYPTAYVPNKYDVQDGKLRLERFAEVERLAAERAAAENELESFNFEVSLLLEEAEFVEFASEEEKKKLGTEVPRIRTWLEDDVTKDTPTKEFRDNLLILKNVVRSVKKRAETHGVLPKKFEMLDQLMNTSMSLAKMGENVDEEKALFAKNDREAFMKKLEKLNTWIAENKEILKKKEKWEDFVISVKDVDTKITNLNREVDKFMKKMKKVTTIDDLAKEGKVDIDDVAAEGEKKKAEEEEAKEKAAKEENNTSEKKTEL